MKSILILAIVATGFAATIDASHKGAEAKAAFLTSCKVPSMPAKAPAMAAAPRGD